MTKHIEDSSYQHTDMLVWLWLDTLHLTDPKCISLSLGLNRHDTNNNDNIRFFFLSLGGLLMNREVSQ